MQQDNQPKAQHKGQVAEHLLSQIIIFIDI